nr:hypothetical protein P5629_11420 [Bacillus subtilis]
MSILDVIKQSNDMMPESYKELSRKDMETRVAAIKKKFGKQALYTRPSLSKG